jgi:hypothetical protein
MRVECDRNAILARRIDRLEQRRLIDHHPRVGVARNPASPPAMTQPKHAGDAHLATGSAPRSPLRGRLGRLVEAGFEVGHEVLVLSPALDVERRERSRQELPDTVALILDQSDEAVGFGARLRDDLGGLALGPCAVLGHDLRRAAVGGGNGPGQDLLRLAFDFGAARNSKARTGQAFASFSAPGDGW